MNYLGLTKQERIVILFLAISIVIGSGLKLYKRLRPETDAEKQASLAYRAELIQKFKEKTAHADSLRKCVSDSAQEIAARKPLKSDARKARLEKALKGKKININSAAIEELEILPAIGPVRANEIIKYRNQVGRFKKPKDILAVKGIGHKTFKKIEPYISVE
ncbi:helix-hairpin-helix domain-containing protein [candidate division KSB1 bacterium]|nr:helix-hairpin-helix domain-containing protein [candidate division KSB1 bacterium]